MRIAITHTATLSMNYQLPIGKGRGVGNDWGGVAQALLGGWNVSGILSVRSGLPVTATDTAGWGAGPSNNSGFSVERPNLTGADALVDKRRVSLSKNGRASRSKKAGLKPKRPVPRHPPQTSSAWDSCSTSCSQASGPSRRRLSSSTRRPCSR